MIASEPHHPILAEVIELMVKRAKNHRLYEIDGFVHVLTGPAVWTAAIARFLGLSESLSAADIGKAAYNDPTTKERVKEFGICIVLPSFWGGDSAVNAKNMYGSQNFHDKYASWLDESSEEVAKHQAKAGTV